MVVFLHEWGHSVGLLHDDDRALIMNPSYDQRQRTFSDFDKEVLALVIERRLARRSELYLEYINRRYGPNPAPKPAEPGTAPQAGHG